VHFCHNGARQRLWAFGIPRRRTAQGRLCPWSLGFPPASGDGPSP